MSLYTHGLNILQHRQCPVGVYAGNHDTTCLWTVLERPHLFDLVNNLIAHHTQWRAGATSTTSSRPTARWPTVTSAIHHIILNGEPGRQIQLRRSLWQGDPLSPMLFIIAMGPPCKEFLTWQRHRDCSTQSGPTPSNSEPVSTPMMQLFLSGPLHKIWSISEVSCNPLMRQPSYSQTCRNPSYTQYSVRLLNWSVTCPKKKWSVTSAFPGRICQFPCRYLGLPLRIGRTRRADEQILIDKIRARLSGWKGRLLTKAGRMTLVSSVLSSIPTYHLWCQNGQSSVLTGYDVISFGEEKILQEVATARLIGYASVGPKS